MIMAGCTEMQRVICTDHIGVENDHKEMINYITFIGTYMW